MAALRGMAGLEFRESIIPQWQFCGISTAACGSVRLAGDRKVSCLSGCGMIQADQWRKLETISGR